MADGGQLRHLLDYNQWADEKIVAAIAGASADELAQPREAYFGSIASNLLHTLNVQRLWLARWKGAPPPALDEPMSTTWRDAFAASHRDLRDHVFPMKDADLDRVVQGRDSRGNAYAMPLARLVAHLVNHGTQHRAETGLLLERIGRSPGNLDYFYFVIERP
jgi:uncharacterized damage-inducible protein DinB